MSKVQVIVLKAGGAKALSEPAETLGELRKAQGAENMLASINGDSVTDESTQLEEHDFVTFTEQVKGAAKAKTAKRTSKKISKNAKKSTKKASKKSSKK